MSATGTARPVRQVAGFLDRQRLALALLVLAAVAWALMFYGEALGGPLSHDHGSHGQPVPGHSAGHAGATAGPGGTVTTARVLGETGAWAVMVVAMMVPPALPFFTMLRRLVAARPRRTTLLALGLIMFTGAWVLVGVVLVTTNLLLGALVAPAVPVATGVVLVLAGVYQFTPLKDACLRGCRSPRSFALAHWHGRHPAAEAARLSAAYAASCIGCCWALMAVCLVVGSAALPAMVVLAVVMAAERLVTWGRRLARGTGLGLAALGVAVLAGGVPATVFTG